MSRIFKNLIKLIGITLALIFSENKAYCQTFILPDTNFRNVLMSRYPSVMTGDKLNISAANSFFFDLIITNANISDLTGIENFRSVFKIDASNNKIKTVPNLSPITNLEYIYLNFNQLTNANFVIGNTNLLQIQLYYNNLISFPELPGFTKLQKLFLSGNQISGMSGLQYLTALENLQLGVNKLDSLPDLSKNTKLTELHCDRNGLKYLNGAEKIKGLKVIYCWGNEIEDLSNLNKITTLEELYADYNLLTTLPDLSNKPSLRKLAVNNNKLTFEDLLPLTQLPGFSNFAYAPQDSIGERVEKTVRYLEPVNFAVDEDAGLSGNQYAWYKNNTLIGSETLSGLNISKAKPSDAGEYRAEITNPALPSLTLQHRVWRINVDNSCMDINSYGYKILSQDCKEGTGFKVEVSTEGSQPPITYTLNIAGTSDTIHSASGVFTNIPAGNYMLRLKDQKGCRILLDTQLTIYKASDCDPVISPLEGGQQSSYFIDKPGVARILDMNGNIIRELLAPATWDGTGSGGEIVTTGYYVITIDNKKLTNITVVR
ncbi:MAG: leucine-rich repeat domain-containing protein [Sporocytophaga sp.]|uniref:leucine-rich repeat domain-containing protein n=1 Tax=Sporocytophaga sp. TaxID=2231183 RepID=UPI001B0104D2|nr:leucine-rich repeat domain-containing protein [Sporocytophaga sp.]MBO9699047.1 leucine-rich repeat domain-containing protein [Sporocytophaga sp.]